MHLIDQILATDGLAGGTSLPGGAEAFALLLSPPAWPAGTSLSDMQLLRPRAPSEEGGRSGT